MAELTTPGFVSSAQTGKALANPTQGLLTLIATAERTGGALTAFESTAAPGQGPPLHLHLHEDELIYVLEGRLRVRLEDAVEAAPAGSCIFVPRGVRHTWQNAAEVPTRMLAVFAPGAPAMERFFEQAAEMPADMRLAGAFGDLSEAAGMVVVGRRFRERVLGVSDGT